MDNTTLNQHYQQILGDTAPWKVKGVKLDLEKLINEIALEISPDAIWGCPKCQKRMHIKEWNERKWRHSDSCQFKTILVASVPSVECDEHGSQTVQVPWAEGSSRFTMYFESFAVEVLQACSGSRAAELLQITWAQADGIKQRAVLRGMLKRGELDVEYICVDEKAVGQGHDYITVVTGLKDKEQVVLYIGDGKGEEGLNGFWELIGPGMCAKIKAVSMDLGKSYIKSTNKYCPQAALIFDPFHIMKMINGAVNEVRQREIIVGTVAAKESLKKSRQLWLWGEENLPDKYKARFDVLKNSTLRTAKAWRLKEVWRNFRNCENEAEGMVFFKEWYRMAMASKLEPVKKVARSLKAHFAGIITYLKYRFCNAIAEGVNSRIQLLIQKACGYRNRERLKTDIMFHFGGLDLDPRGNQ